MSHYSDPTAAHALGGINREFSRLEKKAKKLCRLLDEGKSQRKISQRHNPSLPASTGTC